MKWQKIIFQLSRMHQIKPDNTSLSRAVVLGGAGFIGSNIAQILVAEGYQVTVIDGLLNRTQGKRSNINGLLDIVTFIDTPVELTIDLADILRNVDLVIDAMGWTCHLEAIKDPVYDCQLNLQSHIYAIQSIRLARPKLVIYLGSRHQYGRVSDDVITESTCCNPVDVQGIHKLAAERHYQLLAGNEQLNIISLRFGNTFGLNQPVNGHDIGLIGTFITALLSDEPIIVYDGIRRRNCIYASDIANVILRLVDKNLTGFCLFNVSGNELNLTELAQKLIEVTGKGVLEIQPMPKEIAAIEVGSAEFSGLRLERLIGQDFKMSLIPALEKTLAYFRPHF